MPAQQTDDSVDHTLLLGMRAWWLLNRLNFYVLFCAPLAASSFRDSSHTSTLFILPRSHIPVTYAWRHTDVTVQGTVIVLLPIEVAANFDPIRVHR